MNSWQRLSNLDIKKFAISSFNAIYSLNFSSLARPLSHDATIHHFLLNIFYFSIIALNLNFEYVKNKGFQSETAHVKEIEKRKSKWNCSYKMINQTFIFFWNKFNCLFQFRKRFESDNNELSFSIIYWKGRAFLKSSILFRDTSIILSYFYVNFAKAAEKQKWIRQKQHFSEA